MDSLHLVTVAAGALAGLVLLVLLLVNLRRPALGIWPAQPGWRRGLTLWLFRAYCLAMIASALLTLALHGVGAWPRHAVGLPLMLGAYAMSVLAYRALGRHNTYFGTEGLVTGGVYAYSRNPGYVASVAAALGLAVVAASWIAVGFAGGLFGIYLLFALNEERWLSRTYDRAFRDYARRTPRFLDRRSLERALADRAGRA
jgi:protein-S-isoprenylcysteine O-methyltransferase Ste14